MTVYKVHYCIGLVYLIVVCLSDVSHTFKRILLPILLLCTTFFVPFMFLLESSLTNVAIRHIHCILQQKS